MISLSSCDSQIKIIGLRRNYASAQQQICSHMCERVHGCACVCVHAGNDNYNNYR